MNAPPADRPPREQFLVFGAPDLGRDETEEVMAVLASRWLGTGPRVQRFEREFAAWLDVAPECVVAVNSCTAALHLALASLDLAPGDEVVTTPMTFCATANSIIHAGGTPVLADVDPHTMNLSPAAAAAVIGPRTRALLPVHFAGRPVDVHGFRALADRHGLALVEDCAHAIETTVEGRHAGTFGEFGCFSFYVTKNVVTGEGGMVVGRDAETMARVRRLALHGMSKDAWKRFGAGGYSHYDVSECGFKYNMMDLQAAIGIHQLRRVVANLARRETIWRRYDEAFAGLPLALPAPPAPGTRHARHLYTVLVTPQARLDRDGLLAALGAERIGVGVHYRSLAEHSLYRDRFGWHPDAWPVAADIGRRTLSLPLSPALSDEDVEDVVAAVLRALG